MSENWAMIIVAVVTLVGTIVSVYLNLRGTQETTQGSLDENKMTLTNELMKLLMNSKVEGIDTVLKINDHLEETIDRLRKERDELQLLCNKQQLEIDRLKKECNK